MIALDDINRITVGAHCLTSWPCQHSSIVVLRDGRQACPKSSFEIWSIISNIAEEKINPDQRWNAADVKDHFRQYSKSMPEWGHHAELPEVVLNRMLWVQP